MSRTAKKTKPTSRTSLKLNIENIIRMYHQESAEVHKKYVAEIQSGAISDDDIHKDLRIIRDEMMETIQGAIDVYEGDFNYLYSKLADLEKVDASKLIPLCDRDEALEALGYRDSVIIQVKTMDEIAKIEDFVKREIVPHYNEQRDRLSLNLRFS